MSDDFDIFGKPTDIKKKTEPAKETQEETPKFTPKNKPEPAKLPAVAVGSGDDRGMNEYLMRDSGYEIPENISDEDLNKFVKENLISETVVIGSSDEQPIEEVIESLKSMINEDDIITKPYSKNKKNKKNKKKKQGEKKKEIQTENDDIFNSMARPLIDELDERSLTVNIFTYFFVGLLSLLSISFILFGKGQDIIKEVGPVISIAGLIFYFLFLTIYSKIISVIFSLEYDNVFNSVLFFNLGFYIVASLQILSEIAILAFK